MAKHCLSFCLARGTGCAFSVSDGHYRGEATQLLDPNCGEGQGFKSSPQPPFGRRLQVLLHDSSPPLSQSLLPVRCCPIIVSAPRKRSISFTPRASRFFLPRDRHRHGSNVPRASATGSLGGWTTLASCIWGRLASALTSDTARIVLFFIEQTEQRLEQHDELPV